MSVKAELRWNIDELSGEARKPGLFEYFKDSSREYAGMLFICPCGCGDLCAIDFRPKPAPSWDWDGNVEAPTLTPSVRRIVKRRDTGEQKTHWHGWLRAGVWESC
jgi:hypothetical protein